MLRFASFLLEQPHGVAEKRVSPRHAAFASMGYAPARDWKHNGTDHYRYGHRQGLSGEHTKMLGSHLEQEGFKRHGESWHKQGESVRLVNHGGHHWLDHGVRHSDKAPDPKDDWHKFLARGVHEDAVPVNNAQGGQIAAIGIGPDGTPGVPANTNPNITGGLQRRKKLKSDLSTFLRRTPGSD